MLKMIDRLKYFFVVRMRISKLARLQMSPINRLISWNFTMNRCSDILYLIQQVPSSNWQRHVNFTACGVHYLIKFCKRFTEFHLSSWVDIQTSSIVSMIIWTKTVCLCRTYTKLLNWWSPPIMVMYKPEIFFSESK